MSSERANLLRAFHSLCKLDIFPENGERGGSILLRALRRCFPKHPHSWEKLFATDRFDFFLFQIVTDYQSICLYSRGQKPAGLRIQMCGAAFGVSPPAPSHTTCTHTLFFSHFHLLNTSGGVFFGFLGFFLFLLTWCQNMVCYFKIIKDEIMIIPDYSMFHKQTQSRRLVSGWFVFPSQKDFSFQALLKTKFNLVIGSLWSKYY